MGVGGAGMAVKSRKPTADAMVLAAESLETAEWWRNGIQQSISKAQAREKTLRTARRNTLPPSISLLQDSSELEAQAEAAKAKARQRRASEKPSKNVPGSTGVVPLLMATNVQETASWSGNSSESSWRFLRFSHGLRVMAPTASKAPEHPCLKMSTVANATPEQAFAAVMNLMTVAGLSEF